MEKMSNAPARGASSFVLLLLVILWAPPAMGKDCSKYTLVQLSSCSNAVMLNGGPPSPTCCATLNAWGIECLCYVITQADNSGSLPPNVDRNRVMDLRTECNMEVPPGYNCDGTTIP